MCKMLRIIFIFCIFVFFKLSSYEHSGFPVAMELRERLPEWRVEVCDQFPNGNPKLVLFYSESDDDIYDPKGKARHARPFKPAILIE